MDLFLADGKAPLPSTFGLLQRVPCRPFQLVARVSVGFHSLIQAWAGGALRRMDRRYHAPGGPSQPLVHLCHP